MFIPNTLGRVSLEAPRDSGKTTNDSSNSKWGMIMGDSAGFDGRQAGHIHFRKRPRRTTHATRGALNGSKNFLVSVSVRAGFSACFFEISVLSACPASFDPRGFPLDQRGGSCFGNRGLGFGIRGDIGRSFYSSTDIAWFVAC